MSSDTIALADILATGRVFGSAAEVAPEMLAWHNGRSAEHVSMRDVLTTQVRGQVGGQHHECTVARACRG
jgi:hypothetical protein